MAASRRSRRPRPRSSAGVSKRLKKFENPEDLGLQDQCLAFLTAGPPMLPYSYNSNYQIVQTNDAVVVHAEMIHDARIIHLDGRPHLPPSIRLWLGDSIGRWEGNTLVVDTTNFNDGGGFYGDAGGNFGWDRNLHLVERFSLFDADTLLYQFEIDNPTAFTRPWKGELTMTRATEQHLRVRLPRRQLLAVEHVEGLPRRRTKASRHGGDPRRRSITSQAVRINQARSRKAADTGGCKTLQPTPFLAINTAMTSDARIHVGRHCATYVATGAAWPAARRRRETRSPRTRFWCRE